MDESNPYEILEINPHSTQREVERSYHRLLSRKPRPEGSDRRRIEWAYLVLADPSRRASFDRTHGYFMHPGLAAGSERTALAFFESGKRAMNSGRWEYACRQFSRALTCQPWEAKYRSYLGLAMAHRGVDIHRARELCLVALRLEPANKLYRDHLALVYDKVGLKKRARRVLDHSGQ